jgi:hypothetical protein
MAPWHALLDEQRGDPEEQGGTRDTKRYKCDIVDAMEHRILTDRGEKAPEDLCGEQAQVSLERFIVTHEYNFNEKVYYFLKNVAKVTIYSSYGATYHIILLFLPYKPSILTDYAEIR